MLLTVTHVVDPPPPPLQVLDIALQAEQVATATPGRHAPDLLLLRLPIADEFASYVGHTALPISLASATLKPLWLSVDLCFPTAIGAG